MKNEDKRKNNRKRKCRQKMSAALLVLLLGFSGCGRADRGQIEEDISGASVGTATDADAAMGISMGEIPEHITYEKINESSGNYSKVDADVIVPDVTSYSVYEEKKIEIDDDYLKTLAGNLFDNGEYEQIKPAWMCTQEELETERAYIDMLANAYNLDEFAEGYEGEKGDLAFACLPDWLYQLYFYYNEVNYDSSTEAELTEEKLIYRYENSYDENGDTYMIDCEACTLRGNVDGKEWILYYQNTLDDDMWLFKTVDGNAIVVQEGYTKNMLVLSSVESGVVGEISSQDNYLDANKYGDNISDEAQCRQMVCDFAEKLGLSEDMEIVCVNNRVVTDADGNKNLNGYRMYMAPVINGVPNYFSNMMCLSTKNESGSQYAYQEYIVFDVSSDGISNVYIAAQYEIGDCLAKDANMLTFEQVDMIAQEHIQEIVETPTEGISSHYTFDRIQLAYATVQYDEGYSLVPVWIYYLKYDKEYLYHQACFGINALDGSVFIACGSYTNMFY